MSILHGIILGIVQGLTEFLPVSSSGHLVLLQRFFGISEGNLFFTVMLHAGSLIAVFAVFHKDIIRLLSHPFCKEGKCLIIATLVTGVIYILLGDIIEKSFGGDYLWPGFLYTALLLWYVSSQQKDSGKSISPGCASFMGFMQGIALFPGVSRSGSTIAGGLISGADKEEAARFSFILSIPAILAGAVKEAAHVSLSDIPWAAVIFGVFFSALFGYLAIRFMLNIIKKQKLSYFSVYLLLLAGITFFAF